MNMMHYEIFMLATRKETGRQEEHQQRGMLQFVLGICPNVPPEATKIASQPVDGGAKHYTGWKLVKLLFGKRCNNNKLDSVIVVLFLAFGGLRLATVYGALPCKDPGNGWVAPAMVTILTVNLFLNTLRLLTIVTIMSKPVGGLILAFDHGAVLVMCFVCML